MSEAKGTCGIAERVSKLHELVHDCSHPISRVFGLSVGYFASSKGRQDVLWIACDPALEQTDVYIVLRQSRGFPRAVRTKGT